MNPTKRIGISLLLGVAVTLALCVLSRLAIRLFPYRDLPMMPKPFFLYALAPGIVVGEQLEPGWIHEFAFYLANCLAYAVAAFCLIALIHAASRRT